MSNSLLQLRMRRNWKKHFDRQWRNVRGRRRSHQYLENSPASPSAEALEARDRVIQLDVEPVYNSNSPADAPIYDANGRHIFTVTN